jgi:hypothetical protein
MYITLPTFSLLFVCVYLPVSSSIYAITLFLLVVNNILATEA